MSPTGHMAIGFIAKYYTPRTPVLLLLIAAYLIDILYFGFVIIGLDKVDCSVWSHSLLMAIVWSVITILISLLITKKSRLSIILGILVFSHWILDFLVWNDLPITFNPSYTTGLGLYNIIGFDPANIQFDKAIIIATEIELGLLAFGLMIYFRAIKKQKVNKVRQHNSI